MEEDWSYSLYGGVQDKMTELQVHCTVCDVTVKDKDWKTHTDTPQHRAFREAHYIDPEIFDSPMGTKAYLLSYPLPKVSYKTQGYRVKA